MSRESSNRLAGLDLIRGFAAFAVAVSHYMIACKLETRLFETTSAVAVEIFFVLSGYVLAPQIAFCLFSTARYRNLGIFFTRRWMRTVPPYFIALFAISMSAKELWSHDFWRYAFYVQNLTSQSNQHDYYTVAWSLSVEEWFYISFPIFLGVIALITRRSNATAVVWGALAYITLVSAGRLHFGDYADWGNEVRRVVAYRVDAIAWGYVLFMILKRVGDVSSARASIAACIWSISTIFIFLVSNSIADTEDRLAEQSSRSPQPRSE